MSNSEAFPYSEQFWIAPGADLVKTEIGGGATRIAPASYDRQVEEVLVRHTGSPEKYLTIEQEQVLAVRVQAGQAAQTELAELEAKTRLTARQQASRDAAFAKAEEGKQAERTLVECNLKFSSYLARASMNILPPGDQAAIAEENKAGIRRRALLNDRLPWLPRDFTSLKSRYADLDDRTQVANMGLMRAAQTYAPDMRGRGGKLVSFLSYATPIIKTDLARYVVRGSPDAHEKPIHVPAQIVESIAQARRDDWQLVMTPEKREELLGYERLQDMIPLDELYFAGAADEEVDREGANAPMLWAGEVVPDEESMDPAYQVFEDLREGLIVKALETLSEREAGVIRLRFGLADGQPRTLDEIGLVYGVTRERVRQIETKAMEKLRHPSRSQPLRDFQTIEEGGALPMRSGDVVKAEHSIGRSALRLMVVPLEVETRPSGGRASWQAYPGESWDEPIRRTPARLEAEYANTASKLKELIFGASLYTFQKSFAEDVNSPYPKILVDRITETFGRELTPTHIADFWHNHLESFLQHLTDQLGDDASPERATQLLSRLLAERMDDNDVIELRVPEGLKGKLGYVGAWLSHGTLRVYGDLGNNAGYEMAGLGHLQVEGSVGHLAGSRMAGNARLEIDGNTGDFLGFATGGRSSILVNGDVGNYCGHRMKSGATIEVLGNAGDNLGFGATGGETMVSGKVGTKKNRPH